MSGKHFHQSSHFQSQLLSGASEWAALPSCIGPGGLLGRGERAWSDIPNVSHVPLCQTPAVGLPVDSGSGCLWIHQRLDEKPSATMGLNKPLLGRAFEWDCFLLMWNGRHRHTLRASFSPSGPLNSSRWIFNERKWVPSRCPLTLKPSALPLPQEVHPFSGPLLSWQES